MPATLGFRSESYSARIRALYEAENRGRRWAISRTSGSGLGGVHETSIGARGHGWGMVVVIGEFFPRPLSSVNRLRDLPQEVDTEGRRPCHLAAQR